MDISVQTKRPQTVYNIGRQQKSVTGGLRVVFTQCACPYCHRYMKIKALNNATTQGLALVLVVHGSISFRNCAVHLN